MSLSRRGLRAAVLLTALALVLAACGGGDDDATGAERSTDTTTTSSSTTTTTTTVAPGPFAPFTGEEVDDRLLEQPAIVVKVSNNDQRSLDALTGIEAADIVIEERIEDRATRFFVVFHSELPDEVGPIRSARSSDIDLLKPLGNPILAYSGANGGVQGQLNGAAGAGEVVLVVDDGSGVNLYRDYDYRAPETLFGDLPFILDKFGERAGSPEPIIGFLEPDDAPRPDGGPDGGITVTGRDTVSFVFVEDEGYVRIQDDEVHVTREGEPLVADNVVIIETRYERSAIDPQSIDAVTTGDGPATLLVGGRVWTGTWERPTPEDQYVLRNADGAELLLDPGRTWISLAPEGSYELEVDAETAALAREVER